MVRACVRACVLACVRVDILCVCVYVRVCILDSIYILNRGVCGFAETGRVRLCRMRLSVMCVLMREVATFPCLSIRHILCP